MIGITKKRVRFAIAATLAISAVSWIDLRVRAADPAPRNQPADQARDLLIKDAIAQFDQLKDFSDNPDIQIDPAKRAALAPRVIPVFRKLVTDFDGLTKADPDNADEAADRRSEYTMYLSLFGDAAATKSLADQAASGDPKQSLEGKRSQLMVAWLTSATDVAAQTKVVDQIEAMAKANPASDALTAQLFQMSKLGSSSPDLSKRLMAILTDVMKSGVADSVRTEIQAEQKLLPMENKPLVIAGKQLDGKDITTADWKGKVVLVDFWATWCPPCVAEIPHVAKMYGKYHSNGFEVLGVSNDSSADILKKFLGDHSNMAWPQLFDDATTTGSNFGPVTLKLGIEGLPTMFLIDKNGVVRSVTAADNMDALIPKLLDEK